MDGVGPKSTRMYIARQLFDLSFLGYDHDGLGSLPARGDAMSMARRVFCGHGHLAIDVESLAEPVVELCGDGTVELTFFAGPASLVFRIPCYDVVILERHLGDDVSSSRLRACLPPCGMAAAMKEAVGWLLSHTVSVEAR